MLSELLERRWEWTDRAVDRLTAELYGPGRSTPHTGGTNIMLAGTTQSGKTSLLLHLLGVSDPALAQQAHDVLSGGRGAGHSRTAAPTRYRWSLSTDYWTLTRGAAPAQPRDDDELAAELGRLRLGDDVCWDPSDRPLEIGLPTRLAGGGQRQELRILDLPGTFAEGEREQQLARELIRRFAPRMAVVLLVFRGDQMTALQHEEIKDDPFVQFWADNPERFRLVPTSAFSPRTLQDAVLKPENLTAPDALVAAIRDHVADELAGTLYGDRARTAELLPLLYPVDLGRSWIKVLRKPHGCMLRAARDQIIDELAATLATANAADYDRLNTPRLELRVAEQLAAEARARMDRRARMEADLVVAQAERESSRALREAYADALAQARGRRSALRTARDDLAGRPVLYQRPDAPDDKSGPTVRARQEDERAAWVAATEMLWTEWLAGHRGLLRRNSLPLDESAIRRQYDEAVNCCQRCGKFRPVWLVPYWGAYRISQDKRAPMARCYQQMTVADLRSWITAELTRAVDKEAEPIQAEEALAAEKLNAAERGYDEAYLRTAQLTRDLDETASADQAADARARQQLASAAKLRTMLDQENAAYVQRLAVEVRSAPTADQGWFAAAALRAVMDLNLMLTAE